MREVRPIEPGRVVRSKAGRDAGRYFVVMSLIDNEFVMMADGGLRGVERQKRKRRKHLYVTQTAITGLKERLEAGENVENHEIRAWLKALTEEGE